VRPVAVLVLSAALSGGAASGATAQDVEAGKKQFETRCAGCHGIDGTGGEIGPNIMDVSRLPAAGAASRTPDGLRKTIQKGNVEAGMPPFVLPPAELNALVAFITASRATAADNPPAGNVETGQRFFYGNGKCSTCHMIRGHGGIIGPDLSNLGRDERVARISQALHNPTALATHGYAGVTVRMRSGATIRGVVKNESNYDLQMLGLNGELYLLKKQDIASESRDAQSLMPPTEGTPAEMRDLLAFLSRLTADGPAPASVTRTPLNATTTVDAPTFASIVNPPLGDWPTYHGHLSGNRLSPLKEVTADNVSRLSPKWMFPIANAKRLEVTPIVVDGVMYVTTANEAFALDARSGRQIWHYSRPLTPGVIGDAGGAINRGVAVLGDRLFMVTDHAHLLALSRLTGQLLWDVEMADFHQHYGATSAPLVVNNLVLSGTSGGDEGDRGFLAAYRATTGEQVWRFLTIPAPGDPAASTWKGRAIEHGCAAAWLTGTYDPATNLVYWPTGNPCPDYNGDERVGDNLYSSSVIAIEPQTGKLRWYFQFSPHNLHDWDAAQTPMLVDANFHGRPRQLLLQANRNGFFYVLDRVTGAFLLGEPFVHKLTWASGIGPDGRPKMLPGSEPTPGGTKTCPSIEGASNWMSTSYNPSTGLFYVMSLEACSIFTKSSAWWEPGKSFYGGGTSKVPGETPQKVLRAIDIQTGKVVWEIPQTGPGDSWGGLFSTATGLVFYCDDSGALAAVDAKTGAPFWHFNTNQSFRASPMTYAVDGRQYIAVAAGSNVIAFGLP
jgi:alcohol dehydrogenase (cytochrome c)